MKHGEAKAGLTEIRRFDDRDMACCTLELARRHLVTFPKHGVVWMIYSDSLGAMARYPEAFTALRRAQRLCPAEKLHVVYGRFGALHEKRGADRFAEYWFRRAIEVFPGDATYHIYLGAALARMGKLQEAADVHRQATRCKEGCIDEAYLNLGLVLRALENYVEARTCFLRALEIDPKYKLARKALADVNQVIKLQSKWASDDDGKG